jgi:hypothetical protein
LNPPPSSTLAATVNPAKLIIGLISTAEEATGDRVR